MQERSLAHNLVFTNVYELKTTIIMDKETKKEQNPLCTIQRVSGSYIRIEIVDYFGTKKVIEVKPYFDKQQLTEIEFLNAIRFLEEEKNKATYAFG